MARKDKAKEDDKKSETGVVDWVCDNATPLLVGGAVVATTVIVYNLLTDDDNDHEDSVASSVINGLLK